MCRKCLIPKTKDEVGKHASTETEGEDRPVSYAQMTSLIEVLENIQKDRRRSGKRTDFTGLATIILALSALFVSYAGLVAQASNQQNYTVVSIFVNYFIMAACLGIYYVAIKIFSAEMRDANTKEQLKKANLGLGIVYGASPFLVLPRLLGWEMVALVI